MVMKKQLPNIKNHMSNNLGYKIVALCVTLVLWVSILGRRDDVLNKSLEVELLLNAQQKITYLNNEKVSVKVSGPRMALKKFSQQEPSVVIDLKQVKSGEFEWKFTKRDFNLPLGVRLLSIEPQKVRGYIEAIQQ